MLRPLWPDGRLAAVTITFDGAYEETLRCVVPVMTQSGAVATWFVVTGYVGGFLEGRAVADWLALVELTRAGMELGSHTVTHPCLRAPFPRELRVCVKDAAIALLRRGPAAVFEVADGLSRRAGVRRIVQEAVQAARVLESRISGCKVESFAYPHGRYDDRLIGALRACGFRSARTTDDGINGAQVDPFRLLTKVVDETTTLDVMSQWVEEAIAHRGWLIETYHLVADRPFARYRWRTERRLFEAHVADLVQRPVWVATQGEVIRYLQGNHHASQAVSDD